MKIMVSLPILWILIGSPAMAQDCLWVDTEEAVKYLPALQKEMDDLLDWPRETCEEALKVSMQAYTNCFCDVNSDEIAAFRKNLGHLIDTVHPEWKGKKVCYKSDEYTSQNVFIGSFESIVGRCPEN